MRDDDCAIVANNVGKCYGLYAQPTDRLKELLWGRWRRYSRDFWALRDVTFSVRKGEVLGLVGRNGAGKSTLLQMVCGTLRPSTGTLQVQGRVAALLELGAGFNPEFTGIENVFMNGMILGLKRHEVEARLDGILAFADIGDFAFQPVKTYSSGMFVRLAFAVATSVEPDVLVIDEALSVGDGAFARKSFDRIMGLKDAGKTIVFCSHSMYQVEALCSRALWIEGGRVKLAGSASAVASAYQASLNSVLARVPDGAAPAGAGCAGRARILKVWAESDQAAGTTLTLQSGVSDLTICIDFEGDPTLPPPGVAIGFSDAAQLTVTSVISVQDGVQLRMDAQGRGTVSVRFTRIPLLRGRFTVSCFLTTEDGVHPYDLWERCVALEVQQQGAAQGLVMMPHDWIDAAPRG